MWKNKEDEKEYYVKYYKNNKERIKIRNKLRYDTIPEVKYKQAKDMALKRGVDWQLTFDEWWKIWQDSGYWEKRGSKVGQYNMARYFDMGPYSKNNVRIILAEDNCIENHKFRNMNILSDIVCVECWNKIKTLLDNY